MLGGQITPPQFSRPRTLPPVVPRQVCFDASAVGSVVRENRGSRNAHTEDAVGVLFYNSSVVVELRISLLKDDG